MWHPAPLVEHHYVTHRSLPDVAAPEKFSDRGRRTSSGVSSRSMEERIMTSRFLVRSTVFAMLVGLLLLGGLSAIANAAIPGDPTSTAPWISSDKEDYAPGALVTLTGGNWGPGESVHILVDDNLGRTWSHNSDP